MESIVKVSIHDIDDDLLNQLAVLPDAYYERIKFEPARQEPGEWATENCGPIRALAAGELARRSEHGQSHLPTGGN
jgi:hypothetical protein